MKAAEQEARAGKKVRDIQGNSMGQSLEQVLASQLSHEMAVEQVSNTKRLEDRLKMKLMDLNMSLGRVKYNEERKVCLALRQDIITQREMGGAQAKGGAEIVEALFPIPSAL
jgi:hypothetical protein